AHVHDDVGAGLDVVELAGERRRAAGGEVAGGVEDDVLAVDPGTDAGGVHWVTSDGSGPARRCAAAGQGGWRARASPGRPADVPIHAARDGAQAPRTGPFVPRLQLCYAPDRAAPQLRPGPA